MCIDFCINIYVKFFILCNYLNRINIGFFNGVFFFFLELICKDLMYSVFGDDLNFVFNLIVFYLVIFGGFFYC